MRLGTGMWALRTPLSGPGMDDEHFASWWRRENEAGTESDKQPRGVLAVVNPALEPKAEARL